MLDAKQADTIIHSLSKLFRIETGLPATLKFHKVELDHQQGVQIRADWHSSQTLSDESKRVIEACAKKALGAPLPDKAIIYKPTAPEGVVTGLF